MQFHLVSRIFVCITVSSSVQVMSPIRHQAFTWVNAHLLAIGPLETNFSEIWIEIQNFSLKKMHLKMSSANWWPFCPGGGGGGGGSLCWCQNNAAETEVNLQAHILKHSSDSVAQFRSLSDWCHWDATNNPSWKKNQNIYPWCFLWISYRKLKTERLWKKNFLTVNR